VPLTVGSPRWDAILTGFQCLKPIPARIPGKDKMNACNLFTPRVTVLREGAP